eukprot:6486814-Amphidinium_carterae.3
MVEIEKMRCRQTGESTGKKFWVMIRAQFGNAIPYKDALAVAKTDLPQPVFGHFVQVLAGKRKGLADWAQEASEATEQEQKVVAQAMLLMSPHKDIAQYHAGMALLRFFSKVRTPEVHPTIWRCVENKVEEFLVKARCLELPERVVNG